MAYWSGLAFLASQLVAFLGLIVVGRSYDDLCRWDCNWYRMIVERGYDLEPMIGPRADFATWTFFPAIPVLGHLVVTLTGVSAPLALILVGKFSFALSIYWFIRFCGVYRPRIDSRVAACVVALQPYAIYGNVGYTEPLFLAVTCATLVLAREGKVIGAGLAAGLGSLVRLPAVFLAPALAARLWVPAVTARRLPEPRSVLAVMLAPLGLTLFSLYLFAHVGDGLAFFHVLRAWGKTVTDPFGELAPGLLEGVNLLHRLPALVFTAEPVQALREFGAHRAYYAVTAVVALVAVASFARNRDYDLLVFSLGVILTPLAIHLASMPRYVWWQAPILLLAACAVSARRRYAVAYFCASAVVTPITYAGWFSELAFVT